MNRAWIPAGALAGVSVAGLIALGPITDSLGTSVSFPDAVPVTSVASKPGPLAVPVSVNKKSVGDTQTAAFAKTRGGEAAASSSATSGTDGYVGYRRPARTTATTTTPAKKAVKPVKKKTVKRQTSIGAIQSNGDSGLAGGDGGSTNTGETETNLAP